MTQEAYSLAWILPYVREALKQRSNLEFRDYANAVFAELEKARIHGVTRFQPHQYSGGQVFHYEAMPAELRALMSEAFFYLFHKAYIAPDAPDAHLNTPTLHRFRITTRGRTWLQGKEPLPENAERYMRFLHERVPTLDPVIDQYVGESLVAFEREAFFASAVMLGAASEKELYLLADALLLALKAVSRHDRLQDLLIRRRKLSDLLEMTRDTIQKAADSKLIPYLITEGVTPHLMSLFEAIRVQRNDAVHPLNATVSEESVRHLLHSFPYSVAKCEEIRSWLKANPKSI